MPVGLLKDIVRDIPHRTRLLGVDLGTKTIGLAVCDAGMTVAAPLKVIQRKKFNADMQELIKIADEYEIGGFVFGWPLNMDGTRGASCDRVQSFIDEMLNYPQSPWTIRGTDMWIALFDERLSTESVHDFLINNVDMSRTKRKRVVDKLAAQLILQGALEWLQSHSDERI